MGKWTQEEVERAQGLRRDHKTDAEIGSALKRTVVSVEKKLRRLGGRKMLTLRHAATPHHPPPAHVIAEREHAYATTPTLAMRVLGDPRPGRSCLERRT
jgi:hypothetical protein